MENTERWIPIGGGPIVANTEELIFIEGRMIVVGEIATLI